MKRSEKNTGGVSEVLLSPQKQFFYSMAPAIFAAIVMAMLLFSEWAGDFSLASFGLRPREWRGIPGILFFPFLHGGLLHFISNLFPFLLLSTLIYNTVRPVFWKVWTFIFLLSGIWTWCFARPGLVIGASAWVYGLLGFLLVAGFSKLGRKMMIIAGGLAFLYGGMVIGLLPIKAEISWEGHLMGLLSGIAAAVYWRKEIRLHQVEKTELKIQETEAEAPYDYWLQPEAHFIDANRRIIPREDIIWENGKPRIRTEEEKMPESNPENIPPTESSVGSTYRNGPWTITIS